MQAIKTLAGEFRPMAGLSLEQAERRYLDGLLTGRQWRVYCLFWDWAAGRYSGAVGLRHDRLYRANKPAYLYRLNRFRRAMGLAEYHN